MSEIKSQNFAYKPILLITLSYVILFYGHISMIITFSPLNLMAFSLQDEKVFYLLLKYLRKPVRHIHKLHPNFGSYINNFRGDYYE